MTSKIIAQGAEATISLDEKVITKNRISKSYRIKVLDEKIRKLRTRAEAKILEKAGKTINVPKVLNSDEKTKKIQMQFIDGKTLSDNLNSFEQKQQLTICEKIGEQVAKLHQAGIIHSDLTTSNMIYKNNKIFLIDFGLSFQNGKYEDKAVDIHLFKQALEAKHFENWEELYKSFLKGYSKKNKKESEKVLNQLNKVEKRGRYKH